MLSLAALGSGLLAGLAASPHCALMCGPLQQLQQPSSAAQLLRLHAGRILGYSLLGAAAGAAGMWLLRWLPDPARGLPLQALAALILIGVGVHRLQRLRRGARCGGCRPAGAASGYRRGLLWAALPCGALYAMLFLAAVSGSVLYGALLLAAFGLGSMPLLAAAGLLPASRGHRRWPALLLVGLGLATLAATLLGSPAAGAAFCLAQS